MFGFIVFLHVLICALLTVVILMQSGRGGGLTEHFAAAESMFGAQTNQYLVKGTTVMAVIFLVTCLSLAYLSAQREKSLLSDEVTVEKPMGLTNELLTMDENALKEQIPVSEQTVNQVKSVMEEVDAGLANPAETTDVPSAAVTP